MPSGIIIKGIGGFYYVETPQGVYECKARGVFRKKDITPVPGDRVNITILDREEMKGSIKEILPRTSCLVRPAVANVDQVVAVISVKCPQPDLLLLDKLLITAEQKKINPVICINKVDLDLDGEYEDIVSAYSKSDYKIVLTSFKTKEGFTQLKEVLSGKVTVFSGQSGVGKSTILNMIMESYVMETGEVSEKIKRGRHTTRHAQLIKLSCGGYVVDTPGFSSFEMKGIIHDELQVYYPEFLSFINTCKFTGCSHISEPQCRIKQAVEEGLIDQGRYKRYTQLYSVLKTVSDKRYKK